jgi:hypothetical protein
MTTFITTIKAMYTVQQPDPNYVVNTIWKVTGVDGSYTAYSGGNTTFSSTQSSTFIPYDQLTEAIVISWISEEEIASAQSAVQGQINSLITPPDSPQNTALPWSA